MNLSTARASKKSKEIGIKKTIGADRSSLVTHFLAESIATAFFSLLMAFFLIWLVLPQFNSITDKEILLPLTDPDFVLWSILIALITGLIAGSYPAFYLTSFEPASVLKSQLHNSFSELMIRKGLVVFQFFLSIILIVSVIVISEQLDFLQSKSLGYKKENIISFSREGNSASNMETFLEEIRRIPGVNNAGAISHSFLGRNSNTFGLSWPGKDPEDQILFENVRVSHETLETLGLEFVEGRSFMPENSADTMKIIFNESAIKIMGLKDPVGQVIRLWDEVDLEIIGVVKNFHFQSLHEPVNPLFVRLRPTDTWNIMASIDGARVKETIESMTNFYQTYNPGFTFDYQFQDEQYAKLYASEQRVSTLAKYFAGFAILISCLGLLGLSIFTAERRTREIGIRKILGSSSWNIVMLLSGSFSKVIILSIIFALPVSYYILQNWLTRFAFRIDLQVWYFIIAAILAMLVAWLTVASQALKASWVNPVNCLKEN